MKVFPEESDLDAFLSSRSEPKKSVWDLRVEALERSLLDLRSNLESCSVRSGNHVEVVDRKEASDHFLTAEPKPTEAQKKRGATHLVNCSCCGGVTFRRKSELKRSRTFFCRKSCRKTYQSSL